MMPSGNSSVKRRLLKAGAVICAALALGGCVKLSPRYIGGSEYTRAVMLYEQGYLLDARDIASVVPQESADFKSARKLIADINSVAIAVSRRHMEIGDEYENAGILNSAISEYKTALEFNPADQLIKERLEEANGELALKSLGKQAPRKNQAKDDPEAFAGTHYQKGKAYLDSKAYARAVDEFTLVLKAMPGSYLDTRALLTKARKERDREADVRLKRGIAYFQKEELELAVKEWDGVLEIDPGNKKAEDYKKRAEVIMERIRKIKENQSARP